MPLLSGFCILVIGLAGIPVRERLLNEFIDHLRDLQVQKIIRL